jgi:hypothetical protein
MPMSSEIPVAAFASAVAAIILTLSRQFSAKRCERQAASLKDADFQDSEFRASKANYCLVLCGVVLATAFFWIAEGRPHARLMLISFGVLFLAASVSFLCICLLIRTTISRGLFEYRFGRRTLLKLELRQIRNVYATDGLLVIDAGQQTRNTVPLIFENGHVILAMLRYYRPERN